MTGSNSGAPDAKAIIGDILLYQDSQAVADQQTLLAAFQSTIKPRFTVPHTDKNLSILCTSAEHCLYHSNIDIAMAALLCLRRWKPVMKKHQKVAPAAATVFQQQGLFSASTPAPYSRATSTQKAERQKGSTKKVHGDAAAVQDIIQRTLAMKANPLVQQPVDEEDRRTMEENRKMGWKG